MNFNEYCTKMKNNIYIQILFSKKSLIIKLFTELNN